MVKQLIYDSCMIVKKETIISIYHDIQVVHKKHDGMIVVFLKSIIVLTNLNHKCRFTGELTGKAEPRAASSLLPSALADE